MDVVATMKGKFGRLRARGDQFSVDTKEQFSSRWMAKIGSDEAKAVLSEVNGGGQSPAVVAATVPDKKAAAALKVAEARVAELEAEVAALTAAAAKAEEAQEEAPEKEAEAEKPEQPAEAQESETDDESAPRRRRTR